MNKTNILTEKKYIVDLSVTQYSEGCKQQLHYTYEALIEGAEDDYTLIYEDTEGELKGCETRIHVTGGKRITVKRRGSYSSLMILEKNIRHISHHRTAELSFDMGILCRELYSSLEDGILKFCYLTDFGKEPSGKIEFDYRFRELR